LCVQQGGAIFSALRFSQIKKTGEKAMTLPPDNARTAVVNIRVTEEEKEDLAEQANLCGMTLSQLGRKRLLGRRVVSKVDSHMIAELRRLGGLVKHAFNEGANSQLTAEALQQITQLLKRYNSDHQKSA